MLAQFQGTLHLSLSHFVSFTTMLALSVFSSDLPSAIIASYHPTLYCPHITCSVLHVPMHTSEKKISSYFYLTPFLPPK